MVLIAPLINVPVRCRDTILLYGHLDKQPPMHGWEEGLGPHTPVIRDGKVLRAGLFFRIS